MGASTASGRAPRAARSVIPRGVTSTSWAAACSITPHRIG